MMFARCDDCSIDLDMVWVDLAMVHTDLVIGWRWVESVMVHTDLVIGWRCRVESVMVVRCGDCSVDLALVVVGC